MFRRLIILLFIVGCDDRGGSFAGGGMYGTSIDEDWDFNQTPTNYFEHNTLFGKLIPFSVITYVDLATLEYSDTYSHGLTPLFVKNLKFTDPDGPFTLEYASPSFHETGNGSMLAVLIYKINHNFMQ